MTMLWTQGNIRFKHIVNGSVRNWWHFFEILKNGGKKWSPQLFVTSELWWLNYDFVTILPHTIIFKRRKLIPVDTERKLNVHKTLRRRPERLLNVLCTFNLRPVSTGIKIIHFVWFFSLCSRSSVTKPLRRPMYSFI